MTVKNEGKTKQPSEYKKGDTLYGIVIEKVYFSNNDLGFLIIKGRDDKDIHVFGRSTAKISHLLAETKFLISDFKLNDMEKEIFNYQRVIAINTFLLGDEEASRNILNELLNKLYQRKIIKKKVWYIGVFLTIMILAIVLSVQSYFLENYKLYFKIAALGAIGGFISLNLKLDKVEFQISEGTISYVVVSIYKVIFSMLTSIVCYFLIQSNLIFGALNSFNSNNYFFIYSISALAGFSESLLPNIFNHLEKTYKNNTKE